MPSFSKIIEKSGMGWKAGRKPIYRASITINGRKYFARAYGYKAFKLWVKA